MFPNCLTARVYHPRSADSALYRVISVTLPGSVDDVTNRYREPGRRWHIAVCRRCGADFDAPRRDTAYCSDACRQAAYRDRKRGRATRRGGDA